VTTSAGGTVKTGAAGATVSIPNCAVVAPTFPARSVWLTVTEWGPSLKDGAVNGEVQAEAAPPSTAQVLAPANWSLTLKATCGVDVPID
jgi:hypothetical protein